MEVTFANGVKKMVFEPPDSKGTFLLVDTFKNFPKEPTHETTFGDEMHKLYLAETCGFNNTLAKFARYIPLKDNDTRRHQLEVAFGYVEDKLYRVKKISEGFHPVRVVERTDLNSEEFDGFEAAQMQQKYYSSKGNFMFAQVDLIKSAAVQDDDGNYSMKFSVEQPTIYEPEREKFFRVVPVQDFGRNERGFQEIYLNGKPCADFSKQLRWSKLSGKVLYEKIDENHDAELFKQLMILRGCKDVADYYDYDNNHYDSMSDAELLGYEGNYNSDDLWELNGF